MSPLLVIGLLVGANALLLVCIGGSLQARLEAIRTDMWLAKRRADEFSEATRRLEIAVSALGGRVSNLDGRIAGLDKSMVDNLGPIARQIIQENVSNMIADSMKRGPQ
jgi:hypothetical protein